MKFAFSKDLRDRDGDVYEEGIFAHIGEDTIIKFKDANELEDFAKRILGSMKEIRETA